MTILDYLRGKKLGNQLLDPVLDVIQSEFGSAANENYELIINDDADILVKIPSLKKRDEFEFEDIDKYEYPLIMCMNIDELYTEKHFEYIVKKFLELYKKDLIELCSDVNMVDELKIKVKALKKRIDYVSYFCIGGNILLSILLIFKGNMGTTSKGIIACSIILLFITSIYEQFTKDKQVKSLIDGYISVIKTGWYNTTMRKQYVFLCNIME